MLPTLQARIYSQMIKYNIQDHSNIICYVIFITLIINFIFKVVYT